MTAKILQFDPSTYTHDEAVDTLHSVLRYLQDQFLFWFFIGSEWSRANLAARNIVLDAMIAKLDEGDEQRKEREI
jgi:hypothetical protein